MRLRALRHTDWDGGWGLRGGGLHSSLAIHQALDHSHDSATHARVRCKSSEEGVVIRHIVF